MYTCWIITAYTNIEPRNGSPLRIRPSKCLLRLQGATVPEVLAKVEELNKPCTSWEYEYLYNDLPGVQSSDMLILSTNRFRNHDYDHDTEIANGWRTSSYPYQHHMTLRKEKFMFFHEFSISSPSRTLITHHFQISKTRPSAVLFPHPTTVHLLLYHPAFTFAFGGSFWWSPGANVQVIEMANLPPEQRLPGKYCHSWAIIFDLLHGDFAGYMQLNLWCLAQWPSIEFCTIYTVSPK